VDNIALPASLPITYAWTDPSTIITDPTKDTVRVKPATTTTYTITTFVGGCPSGSSTVTVTVNPLPTATISGSTTVCQNSASPVITFTGANGTPKYTFTYTINGGSNQTVQTASGNSVTVAVPTTTAGTFVYNLVSVQDASSTACSQTQTGTATVTVNPTPTVNAVANQTVCNNSSTTAINFAGTGTQYNWTNTNTSIGLASSGTGNIASFTAVNNGTTVQTATISVTPVTNSGATCSGSPTSFTIAVNPTPTVNSVTNQTVCNNSSTTVVAFSGAVPGTTFSWSNDNTSIGLAANGTGNISSFTATNNGSAPVTATITVTPNFTNGATTCSGAQTTFTITVNPSPTLNPVSNQSVCNNSSTNTITFSGGVSGTVYSWTNDNTSIGLAASGTGDIPSFTATNNGSSPVTATITVTPSFTNSGTTCSAASQTFTITVNPNPTVTVSPVTKCANDPAVAIAATVGSGAGIDYDYVWTVPGGAANPGNVQSFLATVAGTYSVIITDKTTGCGSASASGTLTINPTPSATLGSLDSNSSLCGRLALSIHLLGNPIGTVFNWSRDNINNVKGDESGSVTGTDSSSYSVGKIIDTLYNSTKDTQTVKFTITPTANGCAGSPVTFEVPVSPCVVLPVTIINFKAYQKGSGVEIDWSALNEINFDHYEVQRSTDGVSFTTFARVNAANKGNISNYSETDPSPVNGNNYYRVKAIDNDGSVRYTAIARINICCNKATVTIYPNPVLNKIFNVQLSNMPAGNYKVIMYNSIGQQVILKTLTHIGGSVTQSFKLSSTITAGSYFVRVFNESTNVVVTLIVQ
jgi:hypothetical protein